MRSTPCPHPGPRLWWRRVRPSLRLPSRPRKRQACGDRIGHRTAVRQQASRPPGAAKTETLAGARHRQSPSSPPGQRHRGRAVAAICTGRASRHHGHRRLPRQRARDSPLPKAPAAHSSPAPAAVAGSAISDRSAALGGSFRAQTTRQAPNSHRTAIGREAGWPLMGLAAALVGLDGPDGPKSVRQPGF